MAQKTNVKAKAKAAKPAPKAAVKKKPSTNDAQDVLAKMKQKEAENPDSCPFC